MFNKTKRNPIEISKDVFKYSFWNFYQKHKKYNDVGVSDANPYKLIYIKTDMVKHDGTLLDGEYVKPRNVIGGFWDTAITDFSDTLVYKLVEDKYDNNIPWTDSNYYKDLVNNYGDEQKTQKKLERIDTIYHEITNYGYKTQRQLLDEKPKETSNRCNDWEDPLLNEIGVCIGRNGTLFRHGGGQKRCTVAKYIGVDSLPVQVRVRHKKWQLFRKKVRNLDSITRLTYDEKCLLEHPDIVDISPGNWKKG